MKERQRWRAEEDSILRAYVSQYGPREWNLVSQRMNKTLDRDAKSCLERWKNYLKPGIKRDALSEDEQHLVVSLQAKYGNKWKKIAAEVPGRTAKRLGKWWEVFHEKQQQQQQQQQEKKPKQKLNYISGAGEPGTYDHILQTFAEKRLNPHVTAGCSARLPPWMIGIHNPPIPPPSLRVLASDDVLAAGNGPGTQITDNCTSVQICQTANSGGDLVVQRFCTLLKELEESRRSLHLYRKETSWRLQRLEQQILSQEARRRKEKMAEIEGKIRALREEEKAYLDKVEADHMDEVCKLRRAAEIKETQILEAWTAKHLQICEGLELML